MKQKANKVIRKMFKDKGVFQWEVAESLGVSEVTLIRWLRTPLTDEKKENVIKAINKASTKHSEV